jgi:cysteine-rich repeat protein
MIDCMFPSRMFFSCSKFFLALRSIVQDQVSPSIRSLGSISFSLVGIWLGLRNEGMELTRSLPCAASEVFASPILASIPPGAEVEANFGSFSFPQVMLNRVFGRDLSRVFDLHTSAHAFAPGQGIGQNIVSPLVALTIVDASSGEKVKVHGMERPIAITIPVDTTKMSSLGKMLFAQQARCVYWVNGSYLGDGCEVNISPLDGTRMSLAILTLAYCLGAQVTGVTPTSVNCSCNHLTTFAVNQDVSLPACGDGVIQEGEFCDDQNQVCSCSDAQDTRENIAYEYAYAYTYTYTYT